MKTLDRKLFRDLWHLRGQVLAIAAVIMGGVATMVMSLSTYDSLVTTRDRFYSEYRFAEVFASLKRAPETLAERLAALPGVEHLETRVRAGVKLEVAGFSDPITGLLLSLPDVGEAQLNRLHLKRGRTVQAVEHRRGGAVRHLCRCARVSAGRHARRHHQRQAQDAHRGRRRGVAGVCLPDRARLDVSRLQALRRAVDGAQCAGRGLRHGRRVQPGQPDAGARRARAGRDRPRRRRAGRLRRHRRLRPQEPVLQPLPLRGTEAAADHGHDLPGHLSRRGGLPAECGAEPADRAAARADRHPQGLRLRQSGDRRAFRQAGAADGGAGRGGRGGARRLVRPGPVQRLHGNDVPLSLSRLPHRCAA